MECYITWASDLIKKPSRKEIEGLSTEQFKEQKLRFVLKAIWKESFHDSEEYIDFFLQYRFDAGSTVLVICKEHIVGAAYMLPVMIITEKGEQPAVFGYSLGILKKYRGYGFTGKIHDFIYQYCNENNCAFLVHPANEQLAAYYRSTGLIETGYMKKAIFIYNSFVKAQGISLTDITSAEYARLRNSFFEREGYVSWDVKAVEYALMENRFCVGFCKKLIYRTEEYAVFCRKEGGILIVQEAVIPEQLLPAIMQELAAFYHVSEVTAYLPADSETDGTVIPWMMGYNTPVHNIYCNLLLN